MEDHNLTPNQFLYRCPRRRSLATRTVSNAKAPAVPNPGRSDISPPDNSQNAPEMSPVMQRVVIRPSPKKNPTMGIFFAAISSPILVTVLASVPAAVTIFVPSTNFDF